MSRLSREDLVELGLSIPTEFLTRWAGGQLAATKGREQRLESRGVKAVELAGIRDLLTLVEKRGGEQGNEAPSLPAMALAQRTREEALEFWREAKRIAHAEFGTSPDLLAKFRTGVRTGRLILPLKRELEIAVGLLREHSSQLAGLGATDAFIARGVLLIDRLREAKSALDTAAAGLPPTAVQQCHDKGLLLDRVRRLVRVGRLEFVADPEAAEAFTLRGLRRKGAPTRVPAPGGSKKVADGRSL